MVPKKNPKGENLWECIFFIIICKTQIFLQLKNLFSQAYNNN